MNNQNIHAPSHLREQFLQWLDSYEPNRLQKTDIQPVESVIHALTDCGDIVPADYCDQLEIPKGSTYAQAVENVRQWHKEQNRKKERTAEDVFWDYADRFGEEACEDAVLAYFGREAAAELLLVHIDPSCLEEFLHDNVATDVPASPNVFEQHGPLGQLAEEYFFLAELFGIDNSTESVFAGIEQQIVDTIRNQDGAADVRLVLKRCWQAYSFSDEATRNAVADRLSSLDTGSGTVGSWLERENPMEAESKHAETQSHNWKREGF